MSITLEVAQHIASQLGEGWSAVHPHEGNDRCAEARGPEERALVVFHDTYRNKVEVSGRYPADVDGHRPMARDTLRYGEKAKDNANCSDKREPAAIAKECLRRVLPHYEELFAKVQMRNTRMIGGRATAEAIMSGVLQVAGIAAAKVKVEHSKASFSSYDLGLGIEVWGDWRDGETRIDMKLDNLTPEQANAIAAIIATKGAE